MKQNKSITLIILLINIFIVFLGNGLLIPVLPTLMKELDLTGSTVGYLVATYAIAQFIVSPIAGKWIDRKGRKPFIIIGISSFALSQILFGLGQNTTILFLSRIFGGISVGFVMPAVSAFISDITTLKERPKILGYMSAATNTGLIVGPGLGGSIAEIQIRLPFFVAAAFGFVAAICSIFLLKEKKQAYVLDNIENIGVINPIRKVIQQTYLYPFLLIFLSSFGLATFDSVLSLYVDVKFGFTPKDIGVMILGGAVIGLVAQILLFEKITNKLGEIILTRYIFIVSTTFVFLMTVVNSYLTVMLTSFTLFIGFDLIRPATTSYLSKHSGNEQGFVAGMNSMFTSIAYILGPIVGGILFDIHIEYPFYFASLVLVGGILLSISWKESKRSKSLVEKCIQ